MSISKARIAVLERKAEMIWRLPPGPPEDDARHWWRGDPNFERLKDALRSIVAWARTRGDAVGEALIGAMRCGAVGAFPYPHDPGLLRAVEVEKQLPVAFLEDAYDATIRLAGYADFAAMLEAAENTTGPALLPVCWALQAWGTAERLMRSAHARGEPTVFTPANAPAYRAQILAKHPLFDGVTW